MWGVKEVVTAVLFSALMIVVMFVVGSVTMLGVDFSMLFMAATYVLVVAPLYMLMVMRVNRFGVTAFYACVMALVYLMFGNLWYMLPFYLVGGLAIDALFLRTAAQRAKPNRIVRRGRRSARCTRCRRSSPYWSTFRGTCKSLPK